MVKHIDVQVDERIAKPNYEETNDRQEIMQNDVDMYNQYAGINLEDDEIKNNLSLSSDGLKLEFDGNNISHQMQQVIETEDVSARDNNPSMTKHGVATNTIAEQNQPNAEESMK